MRLAKPYIYSVLMAVLSLPILYWVLGEAVVLFELAKTGAKTRTELAGDFGLGILGLLVVLPGTILGAVGVGFLAWTFFRRTEIEVSEPE